MKVNIVLPWPPSANRYWRNLRGRTLVSKEARAYKNTVEKLAFISGAYKTALPMLGKLCLSIKAYPPDKRKRDIDNLIKVVADSLQYAGFYDNDYQIDKISIERMEGKPPLGELIVEITER